MSWLPFTFGVGTEFGRGSHVSDVPGVDSGGAVGDSDSVNSGFKGGSGGFVLVFDEIQQCPRALASLRYFYEQMPDLHVATAGSLLDFALESISFPVGRVQFHDLFPMTFG